MSSRRTKKLQALARLKERRSGLSASTESKLEEYDVADEGDVYDVVDEREYEELVEKRRQREDFVVDDDGRTNGYETYEAYEYSARLRRRAISGASGSSLLFPRGARVRQIAATQNVTFNYHQNGIEPDHFHSDAGLTSVFRIISTNEDVSGRPFVSVIEPINPDRHPYYGVQFHPEKNLYENAFYPGTSIPYEDINHSTDAIELGSHLGNFLGDLVRRNAGRSTIVGESVRKRNGKSKRNIHAYTDPSRHPLITTYSTIAGVRFEQVYIVRRG
mmetsp:Transcript_3951/g.9035  ORF Transcript_3951/g.9035 Transcript_3951/m.9035 type:complete len:274 (-) Transcript_3951:86-907(-)